MAPKNNPDSKANGGDAQGVRQNRSPRTNRIFDLMRGEAGSASVSYFNRRDANKRRAGCADNKMGPLPKSGDDSLAQGPFDPEMDRR